MVFNTLDYIIFLVLAVAGFWALRRQTTARMTFLFAASCVFYMAWHPAYIILILGSTLIDYFVGKRIYESDAQKDKKRWLMVSLVSNLGLLAPFKYFNFVAQAVCDIGALFGAEWKAIRLADMFRFVVEGLHLPVDMPANFDVLLPVGISFYTFQTLSYSIDIYRGTLEPTKKPFNFAAFVTYFPQLVAGPIVRASEFLPQLKDAPKLSSKRVGEATFLILTGMVKKVVIADYLSINMVDRVFEQPDMYTATEVVVGLYAFTMQIYADFSGYTDIARGSGMLMGLDLPRNFDRPYQSTNPAEFWRRWHMTLSRWLRDYLYFPLGGSRSGPLKAYWNLWLTLFLIGIWHGASWNFVIYGSLQGFAMVLHRFTVRIGRRAADYSPEKARSRLVYFAAIGVAATFGAAAMVNTRSGSLWVAAGLIAVGVFSIILALTHVQSWRNATNIKAPLGIIKILLSLQFVVFSRILFRANDWDNAVALTGRLASDSWSTANVSTTVWWILGIGFVLHYTPRSLFRGLEDYYLRLPSIVQGLVAGSVGAILTQVANSDVVPYIYFQF